MARGRPRTTSLPPDEMIILGKEMIEWVDKHNPKHLSEWYTIEKMYTYKQWDAFTQVPEFLPYYEKALKMVARSYIDGTIPPPIAQRFLRLYFKDMKDQEDSDLQNKLDRELAHKKRQLEHEVKVKSDATQSVSQDIVSQFDATMAQLSALQSSRNMADINCNAAKKS